MACESGALFLAEEEHVPSQTENECRHATDHPDRLDAAVDGAGGREVVPRLGHRGQGVGRARRCFRLVRGVRRNRLRRREHVEQAPHADQSYSNEEQDATGRRLLGGVRLVSALCAVLVEEHAADADESRRNGDSEGDAAERQPRNVRRDQGRMQVLPDGAGCGEQTQDK